MTFPSLRVAIAGLAVGSFAAAAEAQVPGAPAVPANPQVVKWPGGYVVLNGPEVIIRSSNSGGSTNLVTGSGNGFGNRIVVGGGGGGVTVIRNARNGFGNQLIVGADDLLLDLDALAAGPKPACPKPAPVVPAVPPAADPANPPSYKGKDSPFWTKKQFSDAHDCNLYWCPTTKLWFRYAAEDDTYRPVPTQPPAPADEK
jgi:hypothetical protein